jgi:hypothetical protein
MTDRITPLPWFVDVCNSGESCWCRTIGNKEGDDSNEHCVAPSGTLKTADAAYIVHACNNYPKLEALNAELVKEVRELVTFIEYLRKNEGVTLGADFVESGKALLEKAKGVANVL